MIRPVFFLEEMGLADGINALVARVYD